MMVLGREEPLQPNKHIYTLEEHTNEIKRSRVSDDGLNRYSFVWLGEFAERDTRFTDLLRHLAGETSTDGCWVLPWPKFTKEAQALSEERMRRREEEGWAVHTGEEIHIGQRGVELEGMKSFVPENHEPLVGDAGFFLVLGNAPAAPEFTRPPLRRTMEIFARMREFAPSSSFLSFFRERDLTLVYMTRDQYSHMGMVVVTPRTLTVDNHADTIHDNPEAALAWRYVDQ